MNAMRHSCVLFWLGAICVSAALPAVRADEPARSVAHLRGRGIKSWVLTLDNRTLIVSPSDDRKLIYFDTVTGKKTRQIRFDKPAPGRSSLIPGTEG